MTGALPLLCTSGAVLWVALAASAGLAPPVWRVRLFWAAVMLGVYAVMHRSSITGYLPTLGSDIDERAVARIEPAS